MALTQKQVSQLYVSIFNRASEGGGNTNWQTKGTMDEVASLMLATPDAKDYFGPSLSNQEFIETIYKNTLNKTLADDEAGIANWTAKLESNMSRGEVVAEIIEAIYSYAPDGVNYNPADIATVNAYNQFINRVEVSNYMALHVEKTPADYKTTTQFAPLGELVVTADPATVKTAKEKIDAANPANIGKTFTLTAGSQTVTGTDGNDLITGVVSSLTSTKTLDTTDVIDGGAGTDTLKVNMTANFAGFATTGSMKNVEILDVTNASTLQRTFDTTGITGLTTLNLDANDKSFTLSDLAATGITANISNADDTASITIAYAPASGTVAAVNAGTADALTVGLNDVGTVEDATTTATEEKIVTIISEGIETLNVVSNGTANVVKLTATTDVNKEINISGAADLKVTEIDTTVTSVDASTATGDLNLNLTGATINSVTTGSGDDTVTMTAMAVDATIAGGEGADTLVLKGAVTGTIQPGLTGFETIDISAIGNDVLLAGANTLDLTTIKAVDKTGGNLTIAELNAADIAINFIETKGASYSGTHTISVDSAASLTVNTSTANTAITGTFANNVTAANATSLELNVGTLTKFTGNVTANKATSAVINVGDKAVFTTGTVTAAKASSVALTIGTGATATAAITAKEATTATITTGSNYAGTVTLDAATAVSITATEAQSALKLEASKATSLEINSAKAVTLASTTNDLDAMENVSFTGVGGLKITDAIGAKSASVTVDAAGAKTAVGGNAVDVNIANYASYSATNAGQATINGSTIIANSVIIGTGRTEASVTTGLGADTVVYNTVFTSTTEGNVSFDLGTTGGTDTLTLANANNDFSAATVTLSGVDVISAGNSSNSLTMNASVVSGQTINIGSGTAFANVTLNGTSSADTIDVSGLTVAGTGFVVDGGAGADTITLKSGQATTINIDVTSATGAYSSQSTTTAYDKITGFDGAGTNAMITISDTDGTAQAFAGYSGASIAGATATDVKSAAVNTSGIATFTIGNAAGNGTDAYSVASLTEAISLVDAAVTTNGNAVVFEYGANSYLFAQNGDADVLVELTGVTGITDHVNVIA